MKLLDPTRMLFPHEEAAKFADVSVWQLRHWIERGVLAAERASSDGDVPHFLTFKDLVALRVLGILREKVPLEELVEVAAELHKKRESWSSLRFWVASRKVHWRNPETGTIEHPTSGQQATTRYALEEIEQKLKRAAIKARSRKPEDRGKIDPGTRGVMGGQPCIKGTRIPPRVIAEFYEAGYSIPKIIAQYPQLNRADVVGALEYESRSKKKKSTAA